MNRSYIICRMVMSIDGKVTEDFLFRSEMLADSCKGAQLTTGKLLNGKLDMEALAM